MRTRIPSQDSDSVHIPVMLDQVLEVLDPQPGETYVDATFGAGGYTQALLRANSPAAHVIAFDRDPEARARYDAMDTDTRSQILFIDAPFSTLDRELAARQIANIDGVVFDLGVSSPQIDTGARGFSFRLEGPLDMRMDPRAGESAADVVNTYTEGDIADILYTYGEERQSRRIARAILQARQEKPIATTQDLANIIRRVVHKSPKDSSDPATRSFQALRIFVNRELDELAQGLNAAVRVLKTGGRIVVVTFHSLEDRIVKQFFQDLSGRTARPSRHAPAVQDKTAILDLITQKPLSPNDDEIAQNPRARSARLRAAVRTAHPWTGDVA